MSGSAVSSSTTLKRTLSDDLVFNGYETHVLGGNVNFSIGSQPEDPRGNPKRLRISIPTETCNTIIGELVLSQESAKSYSSLFSQTTDSLFDEPKEPSLERVRAVLIAPRINGLFFTPTALLPSELADGVVKFCHKTYFNSPGVDQVMLFGRFSPSDSSPSMGLPPTLLSLLESVAALLRPLLPKDTFSLLFPAVPTQARQAIVNLYHAGQGICPHVDLLKRYGDGIVGVSFGSGCVMRFDRVCPLDAPLPPESDSQPRHRDRWDLYLPERSIIVLSEEARYKWTHGIEQRMEDYVEGASLAEGQWIQRGMRISITFRWMLPGADVVGHCEEAAK